MDFDEENRVKMSGSGQLTLITEEHFPDFLQFYQLNPKKYPFILQSTVTGTEQSRFDILFFNPVSWLKLDNNFQLSSSDGAVTGKNHNFLDKLDELWLAEREVQKSLLFNGKFSSPFCGGWFVFLSYELSQQIEPGLKLPKSDARLPIAYAVRVKTAIVKDHDNNRTYLMTEADINVEQCLHQIISDSRHIKNNPVNFYKKLRIGTIREEKNKKFNAAVKRVKNYLIEGDVFQVNLSRLWQVIINSEQHTITAAQLYNRLRNSNPAPFAAIASIDSCSIISSSPERLIRAKNGQLASRPIAGTRPRSSSLPEDDDLIKELHGHPKEQAEHVMLIDLIRNDLGRVSVPGSVKVDELMVNESYAHVHHIVSNVVGTKQQDVTPGAVIKAIFPGGTITGCPKVRCMEIIAELEQQARTAYTGSLGYINLDGSMDLNILIRTMLLELNGDKQLLSFRAGSGLVFDSIADNELNETRFKAKGLLKALTD